MNLNETTKTAGDNNDNVESLSNMRHENKHTEWTEENEMILVEWCDVAQCYKWLNNRAHASYAYMHAWFTIPAIVLSTISGTASFAQTSLPTSYQSFSPMVIGSLNIFIGILTTVQQYLKISELNEAHRVSSISWDKFARNIRIELAKKPDERMRCEHFLKINRQEFDRLMETSPLLSTSIVAEFEKNFKDNPEFKNVRKPDICNVIVSADKTRYHKTVIEIGEEEFDPEGKLDAAKNELIEAQKEKLKEKESELKIKAAAEQKRIRDELERLKNEKAEAVTASNAYFDKTACIQKYIDGFIELHERYPLSHEIKDNMKDEADPDALTKFLETYNTDNV